jgi:penicillin-binding protein 1A
MTKAVEILGTPAEFKIPSGVGVETVTICRSTGFLAAKSCPLKANIMMATGQVPESYCPWHGGNVMAARNDTNAPQLILTPSDGSIRAKYQLAQAWGNEEQKKEEIFPPTQMPQEAESQPPQPDIEPYIAEESTPRDIERRYQELLDQYNIR